MIIVSSRGNLANIVLILLPYTYLCCNGLQCDMKTESANSIQIVLLLLFRAWLYTKLLCLTLIDTVTLGFIKDALAVSVLYLLVYKTLSVQTKKPCALQLVHGSGSSYIPNTSTKRSTCDSDILAIDLW